MKICICATACKPNLWNKLYDSIGYNQVDFELIFVGPNPPKEKLPYNFKYIYSQVKPAQCFEIAVRATDADYILHIADDFEFRTDRPLDKLLACHKINSIVSTKYMQNEEKLPLSIYKFFANYNCDWVMPINSFLEKKLWERIGGIDKNFIAIYWEIDIAMRVRELGGEIILSDVYVNESKEGDSGKDLWGRIALKDRKTLERLWINNGKVTPFRQAPVEQFKKNYFSIYNQYSLFNTPILTQSEGNRGRWRGSGNILVELIENWLESENIIARIIRKLRNL